MTTTYVLDASAGVELLVNTDRGQVLQEQLVAGARWWVPEHYFVEVAGALRRGALRHVYPQARVSRAFSQLTAASFHRVQVRPLLTEAWAMRGHVTVADAIYVAMAVHLDAVLSLPI